MINKKIEETIQETVKKESIASETLNSTFENAQKQINKIVLSLESNKDSFDHIAFKNDLTDYLNTYHRILYSEISIIIFRFYQNNENGNVDNIIQNLTSLANGISLADGMSEYEKTVLKLLDHVLLANNQYSELATTEDIVKPIIEKSTDDFNKSLNYQKKRLNSLDRNFKGEIEKQKNDLLTQMISIVSIFVGIAFVMFGGMSLLNSLFDFSGMQSVPVNELLCLGSLIGIVIIAAIYAFMIFILRLTGKKIKGMSLLNVTVFVVIGVLVVACFLTYCEWKSNKDSVSENPADQQTTEITETVPEQSQLVNINIYELR